MNSDDWPIWTKLIQLHLMRDLGICDRGAVACFDKDCETCEWNKALKEGEG